MAKVRNTVKANEVNAAYLFLGIGGCGCEIVKRVAKMCHQEERKNISFVCMDTDVNDLKKISDELFFVKTIQTSTSQTVGSFLDNDDDARKNWFPKSAVMYDKTMSEGAGQVRAISRLALDATIKTGRIEPLIDGIDELFIKSGNNMRQSMRCIIASSSSGGTGSGMILPIAMYIRNYVKEKYPNASLITRALLLLPETLDSVIKSQTERDSQARNGYATIKELNAFMMKGSGFVDLDPDLMQYAGLNVQVPIPGSSKLKTLSNLPIDFCFLMDGQDAEDATLPKYEQYKEQAAIALYEQNIGPMSRKAASTEDNIIKELAKSKGRNRFGGIGAGILRYPYQRIVDYIACDLAIDSIGGDGEASKWTKYDKLYEKYLLKEKKNRTPKTQIQDKATYYVQRLESEKDSFSKDLQNAFMDDSNQNIDEYFSALSGRIVGENPKQIGGVVKDSAEQNVQNSFISASSLNMDYESDLDTVMEKGNRGSALTTVKNLWTAVTEKDKNGKLLVEKISEREVEAVFSNTDTKVGSKNAEKYSLETLLYNDITKEITHPCAARGILFKLSQAFTEKAETLKAKKTEIEIDYNKAINKDYAAGLLKARGIEAFSNIEVKKKKEKSAYAEEYYGAIKKIRSYCIDYYKTAALLSAYTTAKIYVDAISDEYQTFFDSFEDKVKSLNRVQDDILSELSYKKGDSVKNICSDFDILTYLSEVSVKKISNDSAMLTPEINGEIFDQIKKNALVNIDIKNSGENLSLENGKKNIFDEILMGHFKKEVSVKCDEINVDIINAMSLEYKLSEEIKAKKEGREFYFMKNEAETYIRDLLKVMRETLASPSIQKMQNEESRMVSRFAYNKMLLDNRTYNIKNLLEGGDDCETVPEYEIRFFNALYNVVPDKIKKFAAPYKTETGFKEGGVYFRAYHDYSKHIGPDSTKNSAMSTHIDKRWDSIKSMPELDDNYQKHLVNNIHKAYIYGIVFGAIQHRPLSTKNGGKKVYVFQNSDDRYEQLVVPNGTLCDEFYEVLDALYVNSKVVEDINAVIKFRKREQSRIKNCNYDQTEFFKAMAQFNLFDFYNSDDSTKKSKELTQAELRRIAVEIEENNKIVQSEGNSRVIDEDAVITPSSEKRLKLVENETSLFAIPMVYYYSLPNSARYMSELIAMVDAVIDVFREEYTVWEKPEDVKFVLCNRLVNEFKLLESNYSNYLDNQDMKIPTWDDNEVIDVIRRKIQEEIRTSPEPEDYENKLDKIAKHNSSAQ